MMEPFTLQAEEILFRGAGAGGRGLEHRPPGFVI